MMTIGIAIFEVGSCNPFGLFPPNHLGACIGSTSLLQTGLALWIVGGVVIAWGLYSKSKRKSPDSSLEH